MVTAIGHILRIDPEVESAGLDDAVVISYANLPQPPKGGYHRILVFKNGGNEAVQEKLVALNKTNVKLLDLAKGHYDVRA